MELILYTKENIVQKVWTHKTEAQANEQMIRICSEILNEATDCELSNNEKEDIEATGEWTCFDEGVTRKYI